MDDEALHSPCRSPRHTTPDRRGQRERRKATLCWLKRVARRQQHNGRRKNSSITEEEKGGERKEKEKEEEEEEEERGPLLKQVLREEYLRYY